MDIKQGIKNIGQLHQYLESYVMKIMSVGFPGENAFLQRQQEK